MNPSVRRIVIPVVVGMLALGVVLSMLNPPAAAPASQPASSAAATSPAAATAPSTSPVIPAATAPETAAASSTSPAASGFVGKFSVKEVEPEDPNRPMQSLGDLNPNEAKFRIDFAPYAAGISSITFSDFWTTPSAKRQADAARRDAEKRAKALAEGKTVSGTPEPMPDDSLRYVLQTSRPIRGVNIPLFAASTIEINGQVINLFSKYWVENTAGKFYIDIVDEAGNDVVRINRQYLIKAGTYTIQLRQKVDNLSRQPLRVRYSSYGPIDLNLEPGGYTDTRRLRFGYLLDPARDPSREIVQSDRLTREHGKLISHFDSVLAAKLPPAQTAEDLTLWPSEESISNKLELSWLGLTGRYFSLAVHSPAERKSGPQRSMSDSVERITFDVGSGITKDDRLVFTMLHSPEVSLTEGLYTDFDLAIYAGPLDRNVFEQEPYQSLAMRGLILYQMSSCFCNTFCTFPWLATFLMWFLGVLHDYVVFDWAIAIIVLVIIVRALLHPLTRRSQIAMSRVSKGMMELKPELEKLQERYRADPQKLQMETLRLYREKGVNPIGCAGGMLPMFLQMPIWIALYAMLYFAFDLRHEPAFFGFFQLFNNWSFLSDLSASDHFFGDLKQPINVLGIFSITGLNIIPLLMGLVFYLQQKFMTPQTTTQLTDEQKQQQAIMKWMTVIIFPLMLYTAPSGLTLYILTSSLIGIGESWHIRKHIKQMELNPPKPKVKKKSDLMGRLYAEALERAKQKAAQKGQAPKPRKDRK